MHTPTKSIDKSNEKYHNTTRDLNDTYDFLKSVPGSLRSNSKVKGFSAEALCQSIELLKMEVQDVREREKSQEDMYKKIIDALKSEMDNSDITKHIEIINYMHKTEVQQLNKRCETKVELKDKQIESLEEKVDELKEK
jgi:predicted  nucleic acid-binding Zn-ribbon protein